MLRKGHILAVLLICASTITAFTVLASAEESLVPSWIKTSVGFWINGDSGDQEFINSIEWLLENKVIEVSSQDDGWREEADKLYRENQRLQDDGWREEADTLYRENQRLQDVADEHYDWYLDQFDQSQKYYNHIQYVEAEYAKLYDSYLYYYTLSNAYERVQDYYQGSSSYSAPPQQKEQQPSCDPSYPDVCIAPYPPDLDCGEIGYSNFRVVGSDPHGFDRDNDGIGCES